jgi:hypothetical protein
VTHHCRYHCRACGGHFTSLEAFDGHRDGPYDHARECSYPVDLVEHDGTCAIADPLAPRVGVSVLSHPRAERAQEAFGTRKGRQAARANVDEGVAAAPAVSTPTTQLLLAERVATCPICKHPVRRGDPRRIVADRLVHSACTPEGLDREFFLTREEREAEKQAAVDRVAAMGEECRARRLAR